MIQDRTVSVERTLSASPEEVFAVIDDLERYPEWNPFTPKVLTGKRVGDAVELHVRMPGKRPMVMHEKMTRYEPGRRIAWGVSWGFGLALECDRVQEVFALPGGGTRYHCYESFRGLLAPLVVLLYGSSMERGFSACADALVARVERR